MAAADAGDRIVVDDLDTRVMQAVEQLLVPCHEECGMRLARRGVLVLDSNVQLLRADPEPDTAARAKAAGFSISSSPSSPPKKRRASSSQPAGAASWT